MAIQQISPPNQTGGGSGDAASEQTFTNVSTVVVTHNKGRRIIARVILDDGSEIDCPVTHTINDATFAFGVNKTGVIVFI